MFTNNLFLMNYATFASLPDGGGDPDNFVKEPVVDHVMNSHSTMIADYLHRLWEQTDIPDTPPNPSQLITASTPFSQVVDAGHIPPAPHYWWHLIYALLCEQTNIVAIVRKTIDGFVYGEDLGIASPATLRWLKTTESIFYRQLRVHDHTSPTTLTSDARDDGSAIRRNAYWRMFGMELTLPKTEAHPFTKASIANREFVDTLVNLLRELWTAYVYRAPAGANPTDESAVGDLAQRLMVMLTDRRINGTLKAEEFAAVAMLDWLRCAISTNSSVVKDLRADAANEAERLQKMAERVGVPAHSNAEDFLALAADMSQLLQGIEDQTYTDINSFQTGLGDALERIITNWSNATGVNLKDQAARRPVPAQVA